MKELLKNFLVVLIAIFLTTTFTEAEKKKKKEKDCIYCKKYEKMKTANNVRSIFKHCNS